MSCNVGSTTISSNKTTWEGAVANPNTLVLTMGKQFRPGSVVVTYSSGGGSNPSITANNVNLPYNATSGSIIYSIDNEPNPAGAITSTTVTSATPSGWLTVNGSDPYTSPISLSCEVNNSTTTEKTATVQLTYTYNTNQTVTKDVTVTQGKAPITIAEAREQATGSVVTRGFVTSCVGNTGYIQDATAAICVYGTALTVGNDVVVSGTLTTYNGLMEITNPTVVAVLSNGNTVTPAVKTIAEINSDYGTNALQGMLVKIENATVTVIDNQNTTISQTISATTSTIVVRGISGVDYQVNDVFTELTGNIGAYNAAQIANPTNVIVQQNTTPVINASNPETLAYNATSGSIAYTISNPTSATLTANLQTGVTWISDIVVGDASVTFNIETNDGNADRTATITLSYTGAEDKVITVTQGHYVVDYAELPFAYDGNGTGALPSGLTVHGTGTYGSSPAIKFDDADNNDIEDYVILKINETPGILTFKIKGNGYSDGTFRVETSANGTDYSIKVEYSGDDIPSSATTKTISDLASSVRYIKWSYTKVTGNVAFGDINLAAYVDPSTVPSIDADAGNDLAYDATNGSIAYEIENYVDGEMSATTTASWITNVTVVPDATVDELGNVTFNVTTNTSTNPRSATVTLTYTYNTNQTVTKDVTVTQDGKPAVVIAPIALSSSASNGTIDVAYANFTPFVANAPALFVDAQCGTAFTDPNPWLIVDFAQVSNVDDYYHIDYVAEANNGASRTLYMKVEVMDDNNVEVSTVVTITQAAYSAPGTWVLTDFADLTPADVFVITGTNDLGTTYYALPNNGGAHKPSVTVVNVNSSTNTLENSPEATLQWNLVITEDGYIFYPAGHTDSWLYCLDDANDGVRIGTGNNKHFTMDDTYNYLTTTETTYQRYIGIYNSTDWRCYKLGNDNSFPTNIAGQTFSFFKKVSAPVSYTKQNIVAYSGTKDKYYLISSPVASVTPSVTNGFATAEYDLYAFDQNEVGAEWRNFEDQTTGGWNIVSGKGYLYASNTNTELTFTGQPYNGNGVVALDYTDGKTFAGWNLIGNPFANPATLDMPYYKMNDDGDGFTAKIEDLTNPVGIMEGVFVQATAANQTATFTAQTSKGGRQSGIAKANLNVIGANGTVIDNAIVRFDEGQTLEKFMLHADGTKIFFTEDHKDYAIVRGNAQGQMPVNFKAAENGTYTIDVEAENLEVNYLHLIDNMTGMDVDLLATPSYTFEGKKSDYASRFKLVFNANAGNNEVDEDFAFISDGNVIILNEGEATLQVIDIMGRIVNTQTVNGNASVNNVGTAGVYVLQLINGNNVKTQKIVVR